SETASHLPSRAFSVPPPSWADGITRGGFGLASDPQTGSSYGFPPFLRVFQGVVEYASDYDATSLIYYPDDRGLEPYLQQQKVTALELTASSAEPRSGGIEVRWLSSIAPGGVFQVTRAAQAAGPFSRVSDAISAQAGQTDYAYLDRTVGPGTQYYYQ